jgi:hypothetical protein
MVSGKRHRTDHNGINLVALENADDALGCRQHRHGRFHASRILRGRFEPPGEVRGGQGLDDARFNGQAPQTR